MQNKAARTLLRAAVLDVLLILSAPPLLLANTVVGEKHAPAGLVVEKVGKGFVGEAAGIEPGDVLLTWVRLSNPPANPTQAHGRLESPFDLSGVEIEQAPRGQIQLSGKRGTKALSVLLPPGEWKIEARPQMRAAFLSIYQQGQRFVEAKETDKGVELWRQLAQQARQEKNGKTASWLYLKTGNVLVDLQMWDEAQQAYRAAIGEATRVPDPSILAQIWTAAGRAFEKQTINSRAESAYCEALLSWERQSPQSLGFATSLNHLADVASYREDLDTAEDLFRKALAINDRLAPGSPNVAASLDGLGRVANSRGDLNAAEDFHRQALAVREKLAPESLEVATSFDYLGSVSLDRSDLDAAEDSYRQAMAIREGLAPGSPDIVVSLNNLGGVAYYRGDLSAAEDLIKKALAIQEKLTPGSLDVAALLTSLGAIADYRGDLSAGEAFHRKALAICETLDPGSLNVAVSLSRVGYVAYLREDLDAAEELYTKALAINESLAPASLDVAYSLTDLGRAAKHRGDLSAAEDSYRKALVIREKLAPGSLNLAETLNSLGDIAYSRGDLGAAEDLHKKALAIQERLAPGMPAMERSLNKLGAVAESRGDLNTAETYFKAAIAIEEKVAPGSLDEAEWLHDIGVFYRRTGRRLEAADAFGRAVAALELQKGKLGGSEEARAGFAAKYADYYRDCVELLLELKRQSDAFQILERSRAKSLLSMLAERDLVFADDISPQLERERKLADAEYDRTQSQIGELSPQKDAQKIDKLLGRLRQLRVKQDEIAEKIKKASPRLASLQYPHPLDLSGTEEALDPGTVLLAYSVGKERSFLFAVQPTGAKSGLSVFTMSVGEKALRESVEAFRNLIDWKTPPGQGPSADLVVLSRSLYDTLIKPAEALIAKGDRILILPDGPLHTLPFGALVREVKAGRPQYLIEWKPLHTAVSATVYAELKRSRREALSAPSVVVAAFGDPKYPMLPLKETGAKRNEGERKPEESAAKAAEDDADPEVRSAVHRGLRLEPLPATRQEVESIASLYAPRAVKYLGGEATEEQAKSLSKDIPYIHFACHAYVNERFPLDSALVLTIPEKPKEGQDNGLLQAWEIFEKVRIDADLVTLSACETGLGKEMGGEGLIGLTRAFQYAGARSVLASLWKVEDRSTEELMTRFYAYLKAGKSKDEALRQAQIDLIHSPDRSLPSHWAAFQINGDWK